MGGIANFLQRLIAKGVNRTSKLSVELPAAQPTSDAAAPDLDLSIGCIDTLRHQVLRGWFIARIPGVRDNRFRVFLNESEVGTFDAVDTRFDLLQAEGVLGCGFAVTVSWGEAWRSIETSVAVTIKSEQGRVVSTYWVPRDELAEAFLPPPAQPVEVPARYKGHIDHFDSTGCSGWVVDLGHPNEPVPLSLCVDDIEVSQFSTGKPRFDLQKKKGLPAAAAGFELSWPSWLFEATARLCVRTRLDRTLIGDLSTQDNPAEADTHVTGYLDALINNQVRPVTIIVSIFNAYEATSQCLTALFRHTLGSADFLLIDDCSTDSRISDLLDSYREQTGCMVVRNLENMGYTRTVNKACAMVPDHDVVLLNCDAFVTERWFHNLKFCAYSTARVATVTPLSDNAGAFSAPEFGVANTFPGFLNHEQVARIITNAGQGRTVNVPTGNGFCMYIRRQAIDELGLFDEQRFPRGYGEENDFCMRAMRRGWEHRVCDKAYVFHQRSQSFGEERQSLLSAGAQQLDKLYPEYKLLTRKYQDVQFCYIRHRIRQAIAQPGEAICPTILYVISTQTGGTPQTNLDLMRALRGRYRCILLSSDSRTLTLSTMNGDELAVLAQHVLAESIEPVTHRSQEYDQVVSNWLYRHSVTLLHIRHIAWHSLGIVDVASAMRIPVVYSIHDYYSLCPALKLLDERLHHCSGRCTLTSGVCQIELWSPAQIPQLKHRFVHRWREMLGAVIERSDRLVTTSSAAAAVVLQVYPEASDRLGIIPHGRSFNEFIAGFGLPAPGEKIRVLVPGNISTAKGAMLVRDMAAVDGGSEVEFHFLGQIWSGLEGIGTHHGRFKREHFVERVRAIRPHLGLIFSIWPETYCHTLTETWACGIPVLALDIGAVGERVRATGGGWLLPVSTSAVEALERLTAIAASSSEMIQRISAVIRWQEDEGRRHTTTWMASQYEDIYRDLGVEPAHGSSGSTSTPGYE